MVIDWFLGVDSFFFVIVFFRNFFLMVFVVVIVFFLVIIVLFFFGLILIWGLFVGVGIVWLVVELLRLLEDLFFFLGFFRMVGDSLWVCLDFKLVSLFKKLFFVFVEKKYKCIFIGFISLWKIIDKLYFLNCNEFVLIVFLDLEESFSFMFILMLFILVVMEWF